jgi:tetratricopeptide (TPR) repeat protein
MKGGDYKLSKSIAKKNLKSDKLQEREKWLYRYIRVDFATGNYSEVIDASKDLILLIEDDKNSKYKEVYRYLFDTYDRLEQKEKMIDAMSKIEKVFGDSYKDIDRYVAVMSIGSDLKDDTMVIKYGTKVMKIQKKSSSYAQSPYVEFTVYQAYMNREEYEKALETISVLDDVKISKEARSRQKYLKATVLGKLWRDSEAKVAYSESIKADPESAWAKLAKSAQEI